MNKNIKLKGNLCIKISYVHHVHANPSECFHRNSLILHFKLKLELYDRCKMTVKVYLLDLDASESAPEVRHDIYLFQKHYQERTLRVFSARPKLTNSLHLCEVLFNLVNSLCANVRTNMIRIVENVNVDR